MHIAIDRNIDRNMFLLSHEDFESYFSNILRDDPEASHSLAEMMLRFMDATLEGPGGSVKAVHSYKDGIEILYLDTAAHDLAFDLYLAWLRGRLKPQDEPIALIKAAIARQTTKGSRRGRQGEQEKRPGKDNVVKITDKAAKGSKKRGSQKSGRRENRAPASAGLGSNRKAPGETGENQLIAAAASK